eukprot:TRINITY_DN56199_c0_g1_i1.p1 TRINITY_DN56199_c0_g1~~TRINITY_DN56199_c0_g1_i1.p1  ORF type:complete len:478 (+),score=31.23 TRINITY_DN56199_c0_g1_i1:49-1482(+)
MSSNPELQHATVAPIAGKGNGVISTAEIEPNTLLIEKEPALMYCTQFPKMRFKHVDKFCFENEVKAHPVYAALQYFTESEETKQKFLELYTSRELEGGHLQPLAENLSKLPMPPKVTHEQFLELAARYDLNCIQVGETNHTAVYSLACRFNHSCAPNCTWWTVATEKDPMCGDRCVSSLTKIKKGEELTTSYLDGNELLLPTETRREILKQLKYFECDCARCNAPDVTRCFNCAEKKCTGHWVWPAETADGIPKTQVKCTKGHVQKKPYLQKVATEERKFAKATQAILDNDKLRTESHIIFLLNELQKSTLHELKHWIPAEVHFLLADLYTQKKDHIQAAFHWLHRFLFIQHTGLLIPQLSWAAEFLADQLVAANLHSMKGKITEFYAFAAATLSTMYMSEHPHVTAAVKKVEDLTQFTGDECGFDECSNSVPTDAAVVCGCGCRSYCSEKCKKAADQGHHGPECPMLAAINATMLQ